MELNFTLILKNNTSNIVTITDNLVGDVTFSSIIFKNVEFDLPNGEYEYLLFINYRTDVKYNFDTNLIDSTVIVENKEIPIKLLRPLIGLLKIEGEKVENIEYNPTINNINYKQNYNIYFYE